MQYFFFSIALLTVTLQTEVLIMHIHSPVVDYNPHEFCHCNPLPENLDFDLAYRIQKEFNVNNPETLFIFGGKLSYKL